MELYIQSLKYFSNISYLIHYNYENKTVIIQDKNTPQYLNLQMIDDEIIIYFSDDVSLVMNYENYYLYVIINNTKWYLIVNEENTLEFILSDSDLIQTYFVIEDSNNIMLKNNNDNIYEYIQNIYYFIFDENYYANIFLTAAIDNNIDIVQYYLMLGLDPNNQNIYGSTALILAAYNNNDNIINLLLNNENTDINHQNNRGETALMYAIFCNNIYIIKLLLNDKRINIQIKDNNEHTALIWAYKCENLEIIRLILEHTTNHLEHVLFLAIYNGKLNIIKLLIEYGADVNVLTSKGYSPLIIAIQTNYIDIVSYFLEIAEQIQLNINHADINGHTALTWARNYNNEEIYQLLLHYGAK